MEEEITIRYMKEVNKWWTGQLVIPDYKEREIYPQIFKFMKQKQIVSITGLRRVGKTTIMLKIIKEYLSSNFPKENIFYFSFDEYNLVRIQEVIDAYLKLMDRKIDSEKYLFVFDEIQKVNNWEEQLKRIYDINPNVKFLISGSESLFIRRKSRESLAGRIFEFRVNPLSFKEYLSFKEKKFNNIDLYKDEILKEFENYLLCNGFPELIDKEKEVSMKYVQEGIIDRVIFRDLVEVFGVKDTAIIKSIFDVIYNHPGQIIEIQELAKEIGITRQAVSQYLEYLEESYLIKKIYNYSRNARKTQRRLKKYYSTLTNPLLIKSEFSKVFEQAMIIQLNADYFWRDSYKNEVDIIKTDPLIAIEVKSGNFKDNAIIPLEVFANKFNPKRTIILSYDMKKKINNVEIIPFYEFILKNL
ncbi:MAG: ATP-binding protein [Nanoarchaeota archaeon]